MPRTTTFIRPELAENAVRAYRRAAGLDTRLSAHDHRRCVALADHCRRGLVTRDEIDRKLQDIAGVTIGRAS